MKKLFILFVLPLVSFAQSSDGFSYSAIVRDAQGAVLPNTTVGIEVTVLADSTSGSAVYSETHNAITDGYGVVALIVGNGTVQSGSLLGIDWGASNHYLKIGVDLSGGSNYAVLSTTQIMSVPYALHARKADTAKYTNLTLGDLLDANNDALNNSLFNLKSQSIGVANADTSAVLEVNSTTQGLLPPRMTQAERDAIFLPAAGLMIWCSDCGINGTFSVYDGTGWTELQLSNPSGSVPTVNTNPITSFGYSSATVTGNVSLNGGSPVLAKGICYAKNPNPNITDNVTPNDTGIGAMNYFLSNLDSNTTYYVRAYAQNQNGIAYGSQQSFKTKRTIAVGDTFGGGIVAYILQGSDIGYVAGEQHGIIVSPFNYSQNAVSFGYCGTSYSGFPNLNSNYLQIDSTKTSAGLMSGHHNAKAVLNSCTNPYNLIALIDGLTLNGFDDWVIPSYYDFIQGIVANKQIIHQSLANNQQISGSYWTSSISGNTAKASVVTTSPSSSNTVSSQSLHNNYRLRPVRYF